MDEVEGLARLATAVVGVLGTVRADRSPHLVPVVFAINAGAVVTAVDHKPKTTTQLKRLTNIRADPHVSLLAHGYDADWANLWWVRVDGEARILESGPQYDAEYDAAVGALQAKYQQYRDRPPVGAVIRMVPDQVVTWAASDQ